MITILLGQRIKELRIKEACKLLAKIGESKEVNNYLDALMSVFF